MNERIWIVFLIFLAISLLNGYLPFKNGKKLQGFLIGGFLTALSFSSLHPEFSLFFPFLALLAIAFSIIHIPYWIFRTFGWVKVGRIVSGILLIGVVLLLLSPWIEDWVFSKIDAKNLLKQHGVLLKDDFELIENSAGGYRDYYHIFKLRISENDYSRLVQEIKRSAYYEEVNGWKQVYEILETDRDTIHFEDKYSYRIEIRSDTPIDDGTYHFVIKISKDDEVLEYTGSDE